MNSVCAAILDEKQTGEELNQNTHKVNIEPKYWNQVSFFQLGLRPELWKCYGQQQ